MKRLGVLLGVVVVALTAYNTWQVRRLAAIVDRHRAEASASARLERALAHARRARTHLNRDNARQASAELDHAIRDVSVAAARSQQSGRSMVLSVRQGISRAGKRVRAALKGDKKEKECRH
jgi:hypothetical protein